MSYSPPISPEQFVEMYKGRKKTIYSNNLPEFYEAGVLKKHAVSVAFEKCEKVNELKAPRCIQPRHPVYNIGLGLYVKPLEHKIYRGISKVFGDDVVVVKGFNVREVAEILEAKWDSFNDPIAVGLDATKFDMHVCEGMLAWEHSIYNAFYKQDPILKRILKMQVYNTGMGFCDDGKLTYKVVGRRFSGDMNTSLGNCLIMCALVWTYAQERGVNIKLMNNGDDCQVIMERVDYFKFTRGLSSWFLAMGFRMVIEPPVIELSQVEFCQMRLVHTSIGPVMVRNVHTAREKDSMCIMPITSEKMFKKWLYAVGECGLALCSGVPVMQAMYQSYMRNGVPSRMGDALAMRSGMRLLAKGLETKSAEITTQARVDVFTAWDITPCEQMLIEEYFSNMTYQYDTRVIDDLLCCLSPHL